MNRYNSSTSQTKPRYMTGIGRRSSNTDNRRSTNKDTREFEQIEQTTEVLDALKDINKSLEKTLEFTNNAHTEIIQHMNIFCDTIKDVKSELINIRNDHKDRHTESKKEPILPLHRRESNNKLTSDLSIAIKDLQNVVETPRNTQNDDNIKILSVLKDILSELKKSNENDDPIDYESKYNKVRKQYEDQFYKFADVIGKYQSTILQCYKTRNMEEMETLVDALEKQITTSSE